MHILITGSSGQIGTNVGVALVDRGDTVLGIDHRPNSWTERIETVLLDLAKARVVDLPASDRFDFVHHRPAYAMFF